MRAKAQCEISPRPLFEKLGVRPGWRAAAIGDLGDAFLDDLKAAIATLSIGRVIADADAIFLAATRAADLRRVETLRRSLQPAGALWIVRPKGRPEIAERHVMNAGRAAGLVDVKVVAFSATHTALKFVIPVKAR